MIYRFAGVTLNTDRRVLTRDSAPVSVEPQVFDILSLLAENPRTLITKDRLVEEIWGGRIVSDATISARISAARVAVGDSGKDQAIIRTVQRRGIELLADVTTVAEPGGEADKPSAPLKQTIRYAKSKDGTSIAWSSAGEGSPVILAFHHMSHLEMEWSSPLVSPFPHSLAQTHRLIRYDIRGTGLSDQMQPDHTFDHHVEDMLCVADAAGLERFAVVGVLNSAAVAIRVAAQNPERISRLVLHNGYARGRAIREGAPEAPEHDPFIALLDSGGWGDPADGFMRAWMTMAIPSASYEDTTHMIELFANSGTTEDALLLRRMIDQLDVTQDLENVACPTRVIHARLGSIHPVAEGRRIAAGIPEAELVELNSSNAVWIATDPTLDQLIEHTLEFLDQDAM